MSTSYVSVYTPLEAFSFCPVCKTYYSSWQGMEDHQTDCDWRIFGDQVIVELSDDDGEDA